MAKIIFFVGSWEIWAGSNFPEPFKNKPDLKVFNSVLLGCVGRVHEVHHRGGEQQWGEDQQDALERRYVEQRDRTNRRTSG